MAWRKQAASSAGSLAEALAAQDAPVVSEVAELYQELLQDAHGAIPTKDALDPVRLRTSLPYTIIYEITEDKDVIYRLVGQQRTEFHGYSPKGRSYREFVEPDRRESAIAAFLCCADHRCAMRVNMAHIFNDGTKVDALYLGLPFADPKDPNNIKFLFFIQEPLKDKHRGLQPIERLKFLQLIDRRFVDLGHGVPRDFEDLVPIPEPGP